MVRRIRRYPADWIKRTLDRRYVGREELSSVDAQVRSYQGLISDLRHRVDALDGRVEAGYAFFGSESPTELRKIVIDSKRLAEECASAIEHLLQTDILLRRDIDAVS